MIRAGIDIGNQTIKVVILKDNQILSQSLVYAGFDTAAASEQALKEALAGARLSRDSIERIKATGAGREYALFADDVATEVTCNAKGAAWLHPSVRTVIDIGAEESRAVKCDATGKVLDFAKNDKCAAGVGAFIDAMAKALDLRIEDMGELSLRSQQEIQVNVTCVVFAESEVVSLIHSGTPRVDIVRAIHDAIASRAAAMVRRIGIEQDILLIGGGANNVGIVDSLEREMGVKVLVPQKPQFVSPLGAALLA